MINWSKMPILEGLKKYENERNLRFHMPGHKGRSVMFQILESFRSSLYEWDVTEVQGTDNLQAPEEMIRAAQVLLSQTQGAKESRFLVNGSTAGIYAAILGLTKPKDKVIVQRNSHQSVFNALYLGDLEPFYLYPQMVAGFDFPSGIGREQVEDVIGECKEAKAMILTRPTYYGTCCDLEEIADCCRKNHILLIVDEAHGAHFAFSELLPKSAIASGADISINSFHKTLPAFTQTAAIHMSRTLCEEQIQRVHHMLNLFQTTSPSYLFLASIDAARHIMDQYGEECLSQLWEWIAAFESRISSLSGVQMLSAKNLSGEEHDFTRIVLKVDAEAAVLSQKLRAQYHIQSEMAEGNNLILIGSIMDQREDYERLAKALEDIFSPKVQGPSADDPGKGFVHTKEAISFPTAPSPVYTPREADQKRQQVVPWNEAVGRVSAEKVTPYPPGIPILLPGEVIDEHVHAYLSEEIKKGTKILKDKSGDQNTLWVLEAKR